MKKQVKNIIISVLFFLCCLFVAVGCGTASNPSVTLYGFDVKETITVNKNTVVKAESPLVTDSAGGTLTVWVRVTDKDGGYVGHVNLEFLADDVGGYTITYTVRDSVNKTHEKTTKVVVTDNEAFALSANYSVQQTVGKTVTINPVCEENATYSYSVVCVADGSNVAVTDGKFTPAQTGEHIVTITAVAGERTVEYSYRIIVSAQATEGIVESFDETWEDLASIRGDARYGTASIVKSEDEGVKDRFGGNDTFLKMTFTAQYPSVYIYPQESLEYYEDLAEKGYTQLRFYIYLNSAKKISHITSLHVGQGKFYGQGGAPTLKHGQWTEFTLNLADMREDWKSSFLSEYDAYKTQSKSLFHIDNTYEWNPEGGGDTMEIYLSDIYVSKPQTITINSSISLSVGETLNFSQIFSSEEPLAYSVAYRGQSSEISSDSYRFNANGEYTFTATAAASNRSGEQSVTVNVNDEFSLSNNEIIKKYDGKTAISFADLALSVNASGGVTSTIKSYVVQKAGAILEQTETGFTANGVGKHEIEIKAEYEKGGEKFVSYHNCDLYLYTDETENAIVVSEDMQSTRHSSWMGEKGGFNTVENGTFEIGGRTVKASKGTTTGETFYVTANPVFPKSYYQAMLDSKKDTTDKLYVTFSYYVEGENKDGGSIITLDTNSQLTMSASMKNVWTDIKFSLSDFIAKYDSVAYAYAEAKAAATENRNVVLPNKGFLVEGYIYGVGVKAVYVTSAQIVSEQGDENQVFGLYEYQGTRYCKWEASMNGFLQKTSGSYTIGGKTDVTAMKFNSAGEFILITATPAYSENYYRGLLDGKKETEAKFVTFSYYVEAVDRDGGSFNMFGGMKKGDLTKDQRNTWFDVKISLAEFVANYDNIVSGYADAKTKAVAGQKSTFDTTNKSYLFNAYVSGCGVSAIYMTEAKIVTEQLDVNSVFTADMLQGTKYCNWQANLNGFLQKTSGSYTIGGKTDVTAVKFTAEGENVLITAKATYSKAYYQAMLDNADSNESKLKVKFSYYIAAEDGNDGSFNVYGNTKSGDLTKEVRNTWVDVEIDLSDFIENYDNLAEGYTLANEKATASQNFALDTTKKSYLFNAYVEFSSLGVSAIYITPATIVTID